MLDHKRKKLYFAIGITGFFLLLLIHYWTNGRQDSIGSKTTQEAKSAQKSAWPGSAVWALALQKIVNEPKSSKPVNKVRVTDAWATAYNLNTEVTAVLTKHDKNKNAWQWLVTGSGIRLTDLMPEENLTHLFDESNKSWYQAKQNPFQNSYLGVSEVSGKKQIQIQTVEYSQEQLEVGLLPWLCKNNRVPGANFHTDDEVRLIGACKGMVREMLLSPTTAEFAGWLGGGKPLSMGKTCDVYWRSWVDDKNAFGVPLRKSFICKHNAQSDQLTVVFE